MGLIIFSALIAAASAARLTSPLWDISLTYNSTLNTVLFTGLHFFGAGNFTSNLANPPGDPSFPFTSGSALLINGAVKPATCSPAPCILNATATSITVNGLTHGGLDAVTWVLSLADGGSSLQWEMLRTVRVAHAPASDRASLVFQTIGAPPIHGSQIPSWLDTAMRFNETGGAGFALGDGQFEFLSDPFQEVKWAPTGALMRFEGSAAGGGAASSAAFSFAKPAMDGTSRTVSLGLQAAAGREGGGAPAMLPVGTQLTRRFSFTLLPEGAQGGRFPALNFSLPASPTNDKFSSLLREFASVQNMFEGFLSGNNPASVVCLHEMGWFPLIQGLFPAGSVGLAAVQREFEYFARCGWDNGSPRNGTDSPYVSCTPGSGGLMHRLASNGFYNAPWGQLQDQNMHFIIGVHALAVANGDKAAAMQLLPAVLRVADYLEANGLATTGIFTSPASGINNGGACAAPPPGMGSSWQPACGSSNWYDVVLMGHFDAYNAALAIWALDDLSDLLTWLGDAPRAAHYAALHDRAVATYNDILWSPEKKFYADWVDAANRARFYFYTDAQFKAIFLGIASKAQGASVLHEYDAILAKLVVDYNATLDDVWGPPSNIIPVTDTMEFVLELEGVEPNVPYPAYENGGSFFHSVGYEVMARAKAGNASAGCE